MSLTFKPQPTTTAVTKVEKTKAKVTPQASGATYVQKVIGGETYLVMAQSQIEVEDEFSNLYYTQQDPSRLLLLPPFDPQVLLNLAQTNNILNQCIEAMEVNIDGTGHDFVKLENENAKEMDKDELQAATDLFGEPYPQHSFVSIRRSLRREMESAGYGYLEVLRNVAGDVVGFRNAKTHHIRMVKLDEPIMVTKTIQRGGKDVEMTMWERERRFCQRIAMSTLVYYREFGTTREIHRETGQWESPTNPIPVYKRGTELMMFGLHPDIRSPYFVPRWVNQMPSVVGSRKAEEQNLEFFDAGGMPPAIIFIQGGTLASDAADQLRNYLSGKNKSKYRAVVVEAQSSSGSLDSAGSVQVRVERFGGEKANDMLYQAYDKNAEDHVRKGFRLPPLFLGQAADYNFATAITAYMVAEAQVFAPERTQFDEVINSTLLKALGFKTLKLKSRPITLKDVANQIAALTLASNASAIDKESLIDSLNDVTGLKMVVSEDPVVDSPKDTSEADAAQIALTHSQAALNNAKAGVTTTEPTVGGTPKEPAEEATTKPTVKPQAKPGVKRPMKKSSLEMLALAQDVATAQGLIFKRSLSEERALVVKREVEDLDQDDVMALNTLVASWAFGSNSADLVHIAGCNHAH